MSNLLMIYSRREPTSIMVEDFFQKTAGDWDTNVSFLCRLAKEVKTVDMQWSDIILAVRPQGQLAARIVKMAHKIGKLTIILLDDDLLVFSGIYEKEMHGVRALKLALKNADIIISGNNMLLHKLLNYTDGDRAILLHTGIDECEIIHNEIIDRDIINIAFYASRGNPESFDNTVLKAMYSLHERFGDRLYWTFFHVCPNLGSTPYKGKVAYIQKMPLTDFRKELAGGRYDIGIMPLEDNEFNRGKYVNHFFEYSRAGIPGIYSNVEPYAGFIEDGKTGLLCDNTVEGWVHAFDRMMDVDTRRRISREAQKELKNKYSMKAVYRNLCKDLPELYTYKNNRSAGIISLMTAKVIDCLNEKLVIQIVWLTHIILNGTFWSILLKFLRKRIRNE